MTEAGHEVEQQAPVDRLRAEAESAFGADLSDLGGVLHGKNGSAEVEVLNPLDWDFDAQDRMLNGDYSGFLRAVLDEENFAKVAELRPSNWQVLQFITGANRGEDLGESPAS